MSEARRVMPVLLVTAIFSRHADALAWARDRLEREWGPLALAGLPFLFEQTDYYTQSMGPALLKQLLAFHDLIDPGTLPDRKLRTNAIEKELIGRYSEARPLNIDPGYLHQGKFVLASMKDHSHRLYLRDGVYAEVTLHYQGGRFQNHPWTYRDYQLPGVQAFLESARAYYRERLGHDP
jgi:Domain of unknown function (DUF4416)